jgi:NYN domain-containing protein
VELSRFKEKTIRCPHCGKAIVRHEEKETDVAIAAKLIEIFADDECDTAVLVTGDTDAAPAVRAVRRMHPAKRVCFAFPYRRKNKELAQLVQTCFQLSKEAYVKYQMPDSIILPNGRTIAKPATW